MGAAGVAVILVRERHIVDAFRRAGAVDPRSAVVPTTIGVAERLAFRKLCRRAVLREASTGLFYLDEPSWQALRALRRRVALIGLLIVLFAAVVFALRAP